MTVRVLVVDDSALMRNLLSEILSQDAEIEVVGVAPDPYIARDKIKQLNPDVLTLDIEMPRMDGLTFLENIMRLRPMPVVMVSSLTEAGAEATLHALEIGAVDFVAKPKLDIASSLRGQEQELRSKVKAAARAKLSSRVPRPAGAAVPAARPRAWRTTEQIIAIGASTGGTEALKTVLERMPPDAPAVLIVQHIPAAFSGPFAERMNRHSPMSVCEARDGQLILPGHAYIAPGDRHLVLARDGARYVCRLSEEVPVNHHRPSADVLFRSVAQNAGANAVGAILTGMGEDGARGLLTLREAGARTLVQDEASSVVWGMPGAAWKLGAAEQTVELQQVAQELLRLCGAEPASAAA